MVSINNLELHLELIYYKLFNRKNTLEEYTKYENYTNLNEIETDLKNTLEYKKLYDKFSGSLVFDEIQCTLQVTNLSEKHYNGITLGNGKIALLTNSSHNGIENSYVTIKYGEYDNIKNKTNVIKGFNFTNISFDSIDDSNKIINTEYVSPYQTLYMKQGVFTINYTVLIKNSQALQIKKEIRVLRQYPYSILQTYYITNIDTENMINVPFYHYKSQDTNTDISYTNNLINLTDDVFYHFFSASNETDAIKLAMTSCYLFDKTDNYKHNGYNVFNDEKKGYNKFTIKQINVNETIEFSILSSMMTSQDVNNPLYETNKMLLNIIDKSSSQIIQRHNEEWLKLWESNIIIEKKIGISEEEDFDIKVFNRTLKLALFNIYCSIRDDINVEINPFNLSTLDMDGSTYWNGELWLIPILLFLKPKVAKTLIDYRYLELEGAKRIALCNGYKGSKYPSENDYASDTNIYWAIQAPMNIYNTALISINTWNYYRVTKDMDWLITKGYKILKNNANFFENIIEADIVDGVLKYDIKNVTSINSQISSQQNNSMTNYFAIEALRVAIESTYELNYKLDSRWLTKYEGMLSNKNKTLPIYDTITYNVNYDLTQDNCTELFVTTKEVEGVNVYTYYKGNEENSNNILGHIFGGYEGNSNNMSSYKLGIDSTLDYTINISSNLESNPITFTTKDDNNCIVNVINANTSNLNDVIGYYNGQVQINGEQLCSYGSMYYNTSNDIRYGNTSENYGYNAFTSETSNINTSINNVIKINESFNINSNVYYPEPYIFMNPYYSKTLFTKYLSNPFTTDIIKDNMVFYSKRTAIDYKENSLNTLLESMMYNTIAQNEGMYYLKKNATQSAYHNALQIDKTSTLEPWKTMYNNKSINEKTNGNINDMSLSSLFIFNMLTTIGGLRIIGSINDARFYTEEFEITNKTGYTMPTTWARMKLTGIGINKEDYTIENSLYN